MEKFHRISSMPITVTRSLDSADVIVEGYAAIYGTVSELLVENGRGIYESIANGAFDEAVANLPNQSIDCVATFEHHRHTLLARSSSGTLQLKSDEKGLWFRFIVPNTTVGNDVKESLQRGDLSHCSFISRAKAGDFTVERREDGFLYREIQKFSTLTDIALVIDPAYKQTYVDEVERSIKQFEDEEKSKQDALDAIALEDKEKADAEAADKVLAAKRSNEAFFASLGIDEIV